MIALITTPPPNAALPVPPVFDRGRAGLAQTLHRRTLLPAIPAERRLKLPRL
jgi:hypothetical protein